MNKPPDKYKCIKVTLKSIINYETDIKILYGAIKRTNLIVFHMYQFLRLWVLYKYPNIHKIDESTI